MANFSLKCKEGICGINWSILRPNLEDLGKVLMKKNLYLSLQRSN